LHGQRLDLTADPELLYVGAMFHDLGLTEKCGHTNQRFEIDGADEARRFLTSYQILDEGVRRVWEGIALHTTPEIPYGRPTLLSGTARSDYGLALRTAKNHAGAHMGIS
jgi:HD superfamily phosphodiesterase